MVYFSPRRIMDMDFSNKRQKFGDDDAGVILSPASPTMSCRSIKLQRLPKKKLDKTTI